MGEDDADRLSASFVSANWFSELGYGAALGRVFIEEVEEQPDASPVVVVSHEFWQARLGADPNIVGQAVWVNDRPAMVVGVASAGFPGLRFENVQIWMPIHQIDYFNPGSQFKTAWGENNVAMYGRLRPGVSPAAAEDGLQPAISELARQRPNDFEEDERLEVLLGAVRFQPPNERQEIRVMILLTGGLTFLVLLVACSNLGNLVLSRAVGRVRELSVRTALGAGRWRVMRQLLTESLVVAGLGAAGGLFLSYWAAKLIVPFAGLPPYLDFAPDWRTMLAAFATMLLAMLVVGLLPAWKVTREDLVSAMKDGGQQTSAGLGRARLRRVLLVLQVAGSCLLLVVAGLMVRGLQRLLTADPGFEFENVVVLSGSPARYGIKEAAARSYWLDVKHAVLSHPQTESVAFASSAPLGDSLSQSSYPDAPGLKVTLLTVEPEFFSVMRVPILLGRAFEPAEGPQATIISRRLAQEMYGTVDVLGRGFPKTKPDKTIVGITGDAALIRYQATDGAEQYFPLQPNSFGNARLIVRAKTNPELLLAPMRQAARAADERVLAQATLIKTAFERKLRPHRVASAVALLISFLALALACLGVFGVVSYGASLRTKEIGIRVALGAQRVSILRMLLYQLAWPAGLGMLLGVTGGGLVGRVLEGQPFYLRLTDGFAYIAPVLTFVVMGGIAALLPALRALRTDPLHALRHE